MTWINPISEKRFNEQLAKPVVYKDGKVYGGFGSEKFDLICIFVKLDIPEGCYSDDEIMKALAGKKFTIQDETNGYMEVDVTVETLDEFEKRSERYTEKLESGEWQDYKDYCRQRRYTDAELKEYYRRTLPMEKLTEMDANMTVEDKRFLDYLFTLDLIEKGSN